MFRASQGGHAPGHLRDAFLELAVPTHGHQVVWWDTDRQVWWEQASLEERLRWITGQLWNCTDILPGEVYDELDLTTRRTYAAAARRLRAQLA